MRNAITTIAVIAIFAPAAAVAQATSIDLSQVTSLACAAVAKKDVEAPVGLDRIAEAILISAGYSPSSLLDDTPITKADFQRKLYAAIATKPANMTAEQRRLVGQLALYLGQNIGPGSRITSKELGLKLVSPQPSSEQASSDRFWLFNVPGVQVSCMPTDPEPSIVQKSQGGTSLAKFGLVNDIDSLGLEGDDRRAASSAAIGVKRTRTRLDDGSRKTDTSLTFDGTFGLRLTGQQASTPTFAFANYTLSRDRTRPAAALAAGARIDDGDTNGLELGLAFQGLGPGSFLLNGHTGYIMDFVKGSRRGVGELSLIVPFNITNLGFCWLGGLKGTSISGAGPRTKCSISIDGAYSHVFRDGRELFKDDGDFLSAGVTVGLQVVPPLHKKSGVAAGLQFRYLPTISGTAPDVSRIDASLKYRWWLPGGAAVDFGGVFKHGRELKTYTKEDELSLAVGLIY